MGKTYLLFVIFISLICNAQDKRYDGRDTALFYKGAAFYEVAFDVYNMDKDIDTTKINNLKENILERAHKCFSELVREYPKSKLYFYALNNKAQIEYELQEDDNAKDTFIEILKSKADDKEPYAGDGIMGEAYTNYKNRACMQLAGIEHENGNYKEAIKYLDLTKKYPYQHFCGNAYASMDIYMAQEYAENYSELGYTEKALDYLLPHIFPNGLADNKELVRFTADVLKKEYGAENIKKIFTTAKKTLKYNEPKKKKSYGNYTIIFLDREIIVPMSYSLYVEDSNDEIKEMSKAMENSLISQLLK